MRIAICTLGCKVNQYETAALERELIERGHSLVEFEQEADAYIVNTCSVTAVSDKKSRQMIRRARKNNPAALVAVVLAFRGKSLLTVALASCATVFVTERLLCLFF